MFYPVVHKIPALAIALSSVLLLNACGNAKFDKVDMQAVASANQYTKPKIDILFVQDDSSSMAGPMAQIKPQLDSFLSGLDDKWDYHFTVVPTSSKLPLTSKYIVAQDCSTINSQYCLSGASKTLFSQAPSGTNYTWINSINTSNGSYDATFTNTISNLNDPSMQSTNFLRPDAALAVVVLSNGDDVSGMSYPTDYMSYQGTGMMIPNPNSANAVASFNSFKSYMNNTVKPIPGLSKFYAVVASNNFSSCYGYAAWQGARYMNMANGSTGVGGAWYDMCGGGLSSVLSNISSQLSTMMQAFIFNYAVIPDQPIVSSIVVKKNGTVVPQSNTNGWSYVGFLSNQPIAFAPYPSNNQTGYFVKMNGTAQYSGTDVITIDYQKP